MRKIAVERQCGAIHAVFVFCGGARCKKNIPMKMKNHQDAFSFSLG
ncbi:hypothetical protein [Bacteroides sp. OF04-15BH]|nr:hypothetical protein [Bacteroides sp. OF04-15BH]